MKVTREIVTAGLCATAMWCLACTSDGGDTGIGPGNSGPIAGNHGDSGGSSASMGGASSSLGGAAPGSGGTRSSGGATNPGNSSGGASGGSGPAAGVGGQSDPGPDTMVPVKVPVKGGGVSVQTKTAQGTKMLITEGVRAALIPSGGIFLVGAGQDVDNNEGFVAAKVTLDGNIVWQGSHSFYEGGTGPVVATDERYYLGGGKLWAFSPDTGAVQESEPPASIYSFAVQNGQVVALTAQPLSSEAQRGATYLVQGTTLTQPEIFNVPHLFWNLPGPVMRTTMSDVERTTPRSLVSLNDGTFGVQGGVRGHTYLVHLNQQRQQVSLWQSTDDDSTYLDYSGLGRRNDTLVYATTVDPVGIVVPATWRVARKSSDLTSDAWSRSLEPIGGNGSAAAGVLVLGSGHILVYGTKGMYILAGEAGEATPFNPAGISSISSVLPLPNGFLVVGASAEGMQISQYTL